SPFIASPKASASTDIWDQGKTFEKLLDALLQFLAPTRASEAIEYALIVLWEMVDKQTVYTEGREADLITCLLQIRYCNDANVGHFLTLVVVSSSFLQVLEATIAVRDAMTSRIEPVYGLMTMHACLNTFHASPAPSADMDEVKLTSYAFGLMALG